MKDQQIGYSQTTGSVSSSVIYDPAGRQVSVTLVGVGTDSFVYDGWGRVVQSTNKRGYVGSTRNDTGWKMLSLVVKLAYGDFTGSTGILGSQTSGTNNMVGLLGVAFGLFNLAFAGFAYSRPVRPQYLISHPSTLLFGGFGFFLASLGAFSFWGPSSEWATALMLGGLLFMAVAILSAVCNAFGFVPRFLRPRYEQISRGSSGRQNEDGV